jgi:hypothetical protein
VASAPDIPGIARFHHDDFRVPSLDHSERRLAARGIAHDREAVLGQDTAQPRPEERVVVDYEDAGPGVGHQPVGVTR